MGTKIVKAERQKEKLVCIFLPEAHPIFRKDRESRIKYPKLCYICIIRKVKLTTMERTFKEALRHRRSYYALAPESPVEDAQIEEIVRFAIKHVPSAFNSQSTRAVLLLHEHHEELWKIVKRTLRAIVPEDAFARTEEKIERSFAAGYGTVLFFEDTNVVRDLQQKFPGYAGNFPVWSEQTSAMHQMAIWTMLEDAGFGASLQHYNPLIDNEVRKRWSLPEEWRLIAQMPFGTPAGEPGEKTFKPLDERIRVFR